MFDAYDILRKLSDGGIVWVESAGNLESARERIKALAIHRPGDYVIFSQAAQSIISTPWVRYEAEPVQPTDYRVRKAKAAHKKPAKKADLKGETRGKHPASSATGKLIVDRAGDIAHSPRHK